jgi:FAD synthase
MRFKDFYLNEAIATEDVNKNPGKNPAVFTAGRFQPFTSGHFKLIQQMKKDGKGAAVILFLVKGKGTGKDKKKNPLSKSEQIKIIKKSAGKDIKEIIEVPDGFLGTFVDILRKKNYEPKGIFVGSDRLQTNKQQIKKYKDIWNINMKAFEIKRTGEDVSATKVRNAVKSDDFDTFQKLTKNLDKSDFKLLQKRLKL